MRYFGYSEFFHDSGISIINDNGDIEFASQSERYSKSKNDNLVHRTLANMVKDDDEICFYENPVERGLATRTLPGGRKVKYSKYIDHGHKMSLMKNHPLDTRYIMHHQSHAAGGLYTRPWDSLEDTVVLSIDGVGEDQTAVIYDHNLNELESVVMGQSIGLMYSYVTHFLGYKTLEDEYVVMGMAAFGQDVFSDLLISFYDDNKGHGQFKFPEFVELLKYQRKHKGVSDVDIAASTQAFAEKKIYDLAKRARKYGSKLVYSGGVAQNIVANTKIKLLFDDMWIPPCPTDGGSSLGTAAYHYCKDTGKDKINWCNAYLGHEMGSINPKEVVEYLLENKYCGIASGKAEFGPRALGNRSLIADVRYDIKDTVNNVKRRQKFRPFAPAILEEYAKEYFEGPMSEYMQYACNAKHDYSSVTHVDGTARVQIVKKDNPSVLRAILEEYYDITKVPMLLNTSLNIRGKPIVNDVYDAYQFQIETNTKVFYNDTH